MLILIIVEIIIFMWLFLLFKTQNYIYLLLQFLLMIGVMSIGLLLINIEFLAFMLILIYAGAVLILFLFVVMLFDGCVVNYNKQNYNRIIKYFILIQSIIWLYIINYSDVERNYESTINWFENGVVCNNYFNLEKEYFMCVNKNKSIEWFYNDYEYSISNNYMYNCGLKDCKIFNQYDDLLLFNEVSIYLFNYCGFEFCLVGLLIFVCLVSMGSILKFKSK